FPVTGVQTCALPIYLPPLDPERAGREGRDGLLPEPARRRAGLAGRLEHALHHVLRVLLPALLGAGRRGAALGRAARRLPHAALGGARRGALLRRLGALLPRRDRARLAAPRPPAPPRVPPGAALAVPGRDRAALAGDARGGGRLHAVAAAVRRRGGLRADAGRAAARLLRRRHARPDARGGDLDVGAAVPRA